ncbi:MAG TPA: glycosyltransferase family 39 protein, partial [Elusimicrobiales bacterium]|nr:glycosyltransferase family 39 protein [Elusimicrobiales bacterium]
YYPVLQVDQGGWYFISKVWLNLGVPPYTGAIADDKPPGIFLVFAISNLLSGENRLFSRFLAAALLVGGGAALWGMARSKIGGIGGAWSLAVYAVVLLWSKTDAAFVDYTESYLITFSVFAFCAYSANSRQRAIWAGMLMGCALLFKQTAVCSLAALLGYAFISSSGRRAAVEDCAKIMAGVVAVNLAAVLFFLAQGSTLSAYFKWVWFFASDYGTYSKSLEVWAENFFFAWRPWLVFLPVLVFFFLTPRSGAECSASFRRVIILWLMCDFTAVNLSGRYFPHQFRQLVPSLALVCGFAAQDISVFWKSAERERLAVSAAILFALGMLFWESKMLLEERINFTHIMAGKLAGELTREGEKVYVAYEGGGAIQTYSGRYSPV